MLNYKGYRVVVVFVVFFEFRVLLIFVFFGLIFLFVFAVFFGFVDFLICLVFKLIFFDFKNDVLKGIKWGVWLLGNFKCLILFIFSWKVL